MPHSTHSAAHAVLATLLLHLHEFIATCGVDEHGVTLSLTATTSSVACPLCQTPSHAVHSRSTRTLADLPIAAHCVRLQLQVRRFFCRNLACVRHIFCERVISLARAYRRHTDTLYAVLQQLGLALGGKSSARLATTLKMPTRWMPVLCRVRTLPSSTNQTPRVLGVDDWSWRKGRRWGTILVDLEQHRPVDLLPDRTAASFTAWLLVHRSVDIISRDRSGAYANGAQQGAPHALQVADRFHLIKNIGDCLEQFLHRMLNVKLLCRRIASREDRLSRCPDEP